MTKAQTRPKFGELGSAYFRAFLGFFAGGVNGSGGVLNIARSSSSVRFLPSPEGRKSSFASSAARADGVVDFFMGHSYE